LSTASRALDPQFNYVTPAVRQRVCEAAQELHYRPDLSARATSGGTTPLVVILVSDMQDSSNADVIHGVMERGSAHDLVVTIADMDRYVDQTVRVIRRLRQMKPQALLLAGSRIGTPQAQDALNAELNLYIDAGGRVVVIGDDDLAFDSVPVPRKQGAFDLVASMVDLGYRNACVITNDNESSTGRSWFEGICDGARATGLRIDQAPTPDVLPSRDAGWAAMKDVLASHDVEMDLVIASSDMVAIGAMSALRDAGYEPGRDIGVAGFGNIVSSSEVLPSLTTVDLCLSQAGEVAVDLALGVETGKQSEPAVARVLLRDSTPRILR